MSSSKAAACVFIKTHNGYADCFFLSFWRMLGAHRPAAAQQQLSYLCTPSLCLCTLRSGGNKTPEPPTGRAEETAGRRSAGTGHPRDTSPGPTSWGCGSNLQTPADKPVRQQISVIPEGAAGGEREAAPLPHAVSRCKPSARGWSGERAGVCGADGGAERSGSLGGGPVSPGWKQRQHSRHPSFLCTEAPRLCRRISSAGCRAPGPPGGVAVRTRGA